jgi:hypothetical protein
VSIAILRSSLRTSLARYSRSWGLWVLLLIAPVGARFWIGNEHDSSAVIAVQDMAPVMTSAVLGVTLGVVVSTLLLPVAFLYLRTNVTRAQPWQVEEVTTGSRIGIALGRFAADVVVLAGVLAAMTLAGWLIGWLVLPAGQLNIAQISLTLWLVAGPALMGVAAVRILFDAVPLLRGALGELAFYILWMLSIVLPVAATVPTAGYAYDMTDFPGFVQPLTYALPPGGEQGLAIGSMDVGSKKIALDVMKGINSDGYIAARLSWAVIAVLIALLAGVIYAPHRPRIRRRRWKWLAWLTSPGAPPRADPRAPPARRALVPLAGVLIAEMRLIAQGRLWLLLAAAAAVSGLFADFRTVTSPAAMLLLAFGLSAHAGRSERPRLLALTGVASFAPMVRRVNFVVAGIAWALLIGAPSIVRGAMAGHLAPLELSLATGAAAAVIAIVLGAAGKAAFAPRLVLLILWYGYLSSA